MIDINREIEQLNWEREPKGLYEPIGYALASGGKRIRPTLTLLACALCGGREEEALPAALALEMFHNFTLLHDDVMDNADIRRGRPTVHKQWNANTAILSGDQMMIEAYKLMSSVRADKLAACMHLFNKMATEICEGQQLDVDFEHRDDVSTADYMEMIRLKTSVLLGTALQTGALLADATPDTQDALYTYGTHVGLAFQLQDDILDVYGDPATFGKQTGGDINCNKKTYLLLTALQRAQGSDREELQTWLTRPASPEKVAGVTALYTKLNVREAAENVMEEHLQTALDALKRVPQNDATEQLRTIGEKLSRREK